MTIRPFWFTNNVILAGNGQGTLKLKVSTGETGQIKRVTFKSTGAFSIVGIRDDGGQIYSDASSPNPILSTMLKTGVTDIEQVIEFDPPLTIVGPNGLNFDLLDTSTSTNTVRSVGQGNKET